MFKQYLFFTLLVSTAVDAKGQAGSQEQGQKPDPRLETSPVRTPFNCETEHIVQATRIFKAQVKQRLPGGTQSRPDKIVACRFQIVLGKIRIYRIDVDFAGEQCHFDLALNFASQKKDDPLMNFSMADEKSDPTVSMPTFIKKGDRKPNRPWKYELPDALAEQVKACKLPSLQQPAAHPGIKAKESTPCAAADQDAYLKTFVDWLHIPGVDASSYTVGKCYIQKKNQAQNLELTDKKGNKFTVSMYLSPVEGRLVVVTEPADYLESLMYLRANPPHPGRIEAPKQNCAGDELGKYIELLSEIVSHESVSSEQFDVESCTIQDRNGRIVSMDVKHHSATKQEKSGFVSMYISAPGSLPAVITEPENFLELLGKATDVSVETEHFSKYFEKVDYKSFFQEHNSEKKTLVGGWTKHGKCEWVHDFAQFVGLDANYFDGATVKDCYSQVVNGINVRFTLTEEGDQLLNGHKEVKVVGYLPAYQGGAASFSAVPEQFIEQLRSAHGILSQCSAEDKKQFAKQFNALAIKSGLKQKFVFSENIKGCMKTKDRIEVSLSLNRRLCSLVALVQEDGLTLQSSDCERAN